MSLLAEISNRVYVRRGKTIRKVFRCPSGFRKGRAVSNPSVCFAPRKKASTRVKIANAARRKAGVRMMKTRVANKKAIHFRLKRMNNQLRGRR